jgi:hypothetical protein
MVAHGGESPTRKTNASRHVAHAIVGHTIKNKKISNFEHALINRPTKKRKPDRRNI